MNMLVKSAEVQCRGPLIKSGIRQPPIRAFMDDLTVTTSVRGSRWILKGLEEIITWACMSFKLSRSRYLVLKTGKTTDKFRCALGSTQIPSIIEKPVKSIGTVFDCSLRDTASELPTRIWKPGSSGTVSGGCQPKRSADATYPP